MTWPASGAGTVDDDGVAYYYGGYLNNKTMPAWSGGAQMMNSLVAFDMNKNTWYNKTIDGVPRAEGSLHYIAAGKRGVLIYFGGVEQVAGQRKYKIHIYDIANGSWYTQVADGSVPSSRRGICAGVTWAADKSSFNIYTFGGIDGTEKGTNDVYVLTIPRFRWILLFPKPQPSVYPGGKGWSSCNVFSSGSQMMIIGGFLTNQSRDACDVPMIGGQHNFFLGQEAHDSFANFEGPSSPFDDDENYGSSTLFWHAPWDNVTRYRVPEEIQDEVKGGEWGGAERRAPATWAVAAISAVFRETYTPTVRTATRTDLPESLRTGRPSGAFLTPVSSASITPSAHHLGGGVIAGIVVGALVLMLALGAAVLFWFKKRRRPQDAPYQAGTTAEMEDQDHTLAKRKWFLGGSWRNEAEAKRDPA